MRISDWSSDVCSSDLIRHGWKPEHAVKLEDMSRKIWALKGKPSLAGFAARIECSAPNPDSARLSSHICPSVEIAGTASKKTCDRQRLIAHLKSARIKLRSEERRVGKEWVSPCRTRWAREK